MSTATALKRPEIKTALPGPKGKAIVEADAKYVNPAYPRPSFKLVADHGEGVWVTDVDGNVFLDCNAGVAVCSTGHCHPEVVKATQEITRPIHQAGHRLQADVMQSAGVSDMLLEGGRRILEK